MARRTYHQMSFWGFMMCFGSTCSGTLLHYGFGLEAPYSWYSLPKLLGVPGGLILCLGTGGLAWLKVKADPSLGAAKIWGGEMAFVLLLFGVSATGLALYAATGTGAVAWLLPIHLGAVLAFFPDHSVFQNGAWILPLGGNGQRCRTRSMENMIADKFRRIHHPARF